jgi:hypothetical protein
MVIFVCGGYGCFYKGKESGKVILGGNEVFLDTGDAEPTVSQISERGIYPALLQKKISPKALAE